jgi:hypothetical protein
VKHPNWQLAHEVLAEIIPGAASFELDELPGLSPEAWTPFPTDDRDPTEVNRDFIAYCEERVGGLLIVVSFASHLLGPLFVHHSRLTGFVESYPDLVDDVLVSGDLVLLSPSHGTVIVIHHNGLIATLLGRPHQW